MASIDEGAHDQVRRGSDRRHDALLAEYGEVGSNFRLLTDIRFKLLALLPIAAAAATALVSSGGDRDAAAEARALALSLFGLVVTLALATYNARNDQLYDTLVGRAAAIERHLGLPDGAFANRPTSWFSFAIPVLGKEWKINHRAPVALIYGTSVALWLFGVAVAGLQLAWGASSAPREVLAGVVVPAALISMLVTWCIGGQREKRSDEMRLDAAATVGIVEEKGLAGAAAYEPFLDRCERLGRVKGRDVIARAGFYSRLERTEQQHFMLHERDRPRAADFVALITDLPADWIDDCAKERRHPLPTEDVDETQASS